MHLESRLSGYLNQEIAYINPISTHSISKTFHDKKDTTLLEITLKAFLKERLYGKLHSFDIENTHNKNHLSARLNSISQNEKTKQFADNNNAREGKVYSILKPRNSFHNQNLSLNKQKSQKSKQGKQKLSQLSSSLDFKSKGYLKKTRNFIQSYKKIKAKNFTNKPINRNKNQKQFEDQNKPEASFISSIDLYQTQKHKLINKLSASFKLPEINNKAKVFHDKIEPNKIAKPLKKQIFSQILFDDDFWGYLCKSKSQKPKRTKQRKIVQIKSLINSTDGPKNTQLKYNQRTLFSKENFQNFINNSIFTVAFFVTNIASFFELMSKVADKCKRVDFESAISSIYSYSDRVWCVAVFRFFDWNCDGIIETSDLFKVHNILEQIICKVEVAKSYQFKSNETFFWNETNRKNGHKRESTQQSIENGLSDESKQMLKSNENTESKKKQKTNQSQIYFGQQCQIFNRFICKNLKNLKFLQMEVVKLNNNIICKDKLVQPFNYQNDLNQKKLNEESQVVYLEEALLKNKDLKISDLTLVLGELANQKSNTKKKVVDIDYKKMNIKLSSSYAQTFVATNHNQQTRINREYLESLKDSIKFRDQQREKNNPELEKKSLPGIRYTQFYEEKFFLPLKKLFIQAICAKVIAPI